MAIEKEALSYYLAIDGVGIYPKAIVDGDGIRKERTEWQEGWNKCVREMTNAANTIKKFLDDLPDKVIDLIKDDRIQVSVSKDEVKLWVLCNDLFYWACADGEDIELNEIPELEKALDESKDHGDLLWVCRKRKMRPQKPYYKYFSTAEKLLFDECGPEREE